MRTRGRLQLLALVFVTATVASCYEVDSRGWVFPRGVGVSRIAAANYFPLASGWKWTYSVWMNGLKTQEVHAVLERKGDLAVVQDGAGRITYVVTPEGIAEKNGDRIGDYVIKSPLSTGAEWAVEGGRARIAFAGGKCGSARVGFYEGCVLISVTRTDPARVIQTMYAPYLGPVSVSIQVADGKDFLTIAQAVLVSVTRPGEAPAVP